MASFHSEDGYFRATIPSVMSLREPLVNRLEKDMLRHNYDPQAARGMSTALYEALNNAIEWGSIGGISKPVYVAWRLDDNGVRIDVIDTGKAPLDCSRSIDTNILKPYQVVEVVSKRSRNAGLGIAMMRACADAVEFTELYGSDGKVGTRTRIIKKRTTSSQSVQAGQGTPQAAREDCFPR